MAAPGTNGLTREQVEARLAVDSAMCAIEAEIGKLRAHEPELDVEVKQRLRWLERRARQIRKR